MLRKHILIIILVIGQGLSLMNCRNTREVAFEELHPPESYAIDTLLELFMVKYHNYVSNHHDTTQFPRSIEEGRLRLVTAENWTSGFFPGILWYLHEYSSNEDLLIAARSWTAALREQSYNTSTHDIGFIINSSYGQGYRLTRDETYLEVMSDAARTLASRFNREVGCIKSLDSLSEFEFPVLIDNMVNLELLYKVWNWKQDEELYQIAYQHALRTMEDQFKPNFSAFQMVDYELDNFQPHFKGSFQGASDSSAWSRGQAWGLYGFVIAFRETRDRVFLDQALRMADYVLTHPNFPADGIPYWDFLAPDIPDAHRDAAAAVIFASAFLELSTYPEVQDRNRYLSVAVTILNSLARKGYIAHAGEQENFVLKHCVGNMPNHSEVDVPVIYGDYYLVEALIKLKNILKNEM